MVGGVRATAVGTTGHTSSHRMNCHRCKLLKGFGSSGWTRSRSFRGAAEERRDRRVQHEDQTGFAGLAPRAELEPATLRLTAGCSAIELPRNVGRTPTFDAGEPQS